MVKTTLLLGSEPNLNTLPLCLTGLRQQAIKADEFDVQVLWNGSETQYKRLEQVRHIFPFNPLKAPEQRSQAIEFALKQITSPHVLFWDSRFLPHRDLLSQHRKAYQQDPEAVYLGSNHLHPQQAMTLLALTLQKQNTLFNFFPIQAPEPEFFHFSLHNCSLSLEHLQHLKFKANTLPYLNWDLGLQLKQKQILFKLLPDASGVFLPLIRLEEVLQEWQLACQQDLTQFIKNWSFLPPGFQAPPSQNINVLKKILSQQQADLCIPVEADDPQALLLREYGSQWAQLRSSVGLAILKKLEQSEKVSSEQRHTLGQQAELKQALQKKQAITGCQPKNTFVLDEKLSTESIQNVQALIIPPRPIAQILAQSAAWLNFLPQGCLLLFPDLIPEMQRLQQLLLQNYPCIRLPECPHSLIWLGMAE